MVIVPPYVGVPRVSHQFPTAALVVTVVIVFDVDVGVDDLPQDENNITASREKLKPNQINLFFNFRSYLINNSTFDLQ